MHVRAFCFKRSVWQTVSNVMHAQRMLHSASAVQWCSSMRVATFSRAVGAT